MNPEVTHRRHGPRSRRVQGKAPTSIDVVRKDAPRLKIGGVVILGLYALTIMVVAFVDSWATPWLALVGCPLVFGGIAALSWRLPALGGALLVLFGLVLGIIGGLIAAADSVGVSIAEGIAVGILLFSPAIASGLLFIVSDTLRLAAYLRRSRTRAAQS
jgi:hypothetical protein